MAVRQAMLMAAGLGTRLKPFTDREPKALLPLLGVPIAQFAIDALARAGVTRVVANVHHHAERARAGLLALKRPPGMELLISDESDGLLGSAGGLRKALPYFYEGEPFYLVNADVLSEFELAKLGRAHERLRKRWGVNLTLAIAPAAPPGAEYREIFCDMAEGRVKRLGELARERPFFIGSAVIEPAALSRIPDEGPSEFVPLVLSPEVEAGRAGFELAEAPWQDVGSPALWLSSHLSLIEGLESGRLEIGIRKRLEESNRRVSDRVWAAAHQRADHSQWFGPAYVGTGRAPKHVAPRSVIYDSAETALSGSIAMKELRFSGS